jgi:hypothetical protein
VISGTIEYSKLKKANDALEVKYQSLKAKFNRFGRQVDAEELEDSEEDCNSNDSQKDWKDEDYADTPENVSEVRSGVPPSQIDEADHDDPLVIQPWRIGEMPMESSEESDERDYGNDSPDMKKDAKRQIKDVGPEYTPLSSPKPEDMEEYDSTEDEPDLAEDEEDGEWDEDSGEEGDEEDEGGESPDANDDDEEDD